MTANIGRNAPCPCGSGRKYKVCCLRTSSDSLEEAVRLQALDRRLVSQVLGGALEGFGADLRAADRFERDHRPRPDDLSLFPHWAAFVHRLEDGTIAEWFLEEHGDTLAAAERAWLADQAEAWLSIWEVLGETGPHTCTVRDLLTGRERSVTGDRALPREPGTAFLARVVTHGDLSLVTGIHPLRAKGPGLAEVVSHLRGNMATGPGPILPGDLRSEGGAGQILVAWSDLVDPEAPETPGNQVPGLILCSDRFLFVDEVRDEAALEAALDSIPGAVRTLEHDQGISGWVFREDPGDPYSRKMAVWELNRSGFVVLGGKEEDLDRVRAAVESAAGAFLRYESRNVTRRSDLLQAGLGVGAWEDDDEVPEVPWSPMEAAAFLSVKAAYYAAWPDTPQPFFEGRTPKEAMAIPRYRRHIELILQDMTEREDVLAKAVRVDVEAVRRALGLDVGDE